MTIDQDPQSMWPLITMLSKDTIAFLKLFERLCLGGLLVVAQMFSVSLVLDVGQQNPQSTSD